MYQEQAKAIDPRGLTAGPCQPSGGPGMHQILEAAFSRLVGRAMHLEALNARFQDCASKSCGDRPTSAPQPPPPSFQQLPEAMHKVLDHIDTMINDIERRVFGS